MNWQQVRCLVCLVVWLMPDTPLELLWFRVWIFTWICCETVGTQFLHGICQNGRVVSTQSLEILEISPTDINSIDLKVTDILKLWNQWLWIRAHILLTFVTVVFLCGSKTYWTTFRANSICVRLILRFGELNSPIVN